jgi:hypothetical protein
MRRNWSKKPLGFWKNDGTGVPLRKLVFGEFGQARVEIAD